MTDSSNIVLGIDLGTTYSCIAYVDEYGQVVVLKNAENQLTTPSVVLFEGDEAIVGEQAKNQAVALPEQVVSEVKRSMGDPNYRFLYADREYRAEEISAYVLRKLAQDASQALGGVAIRDVVITCPAYFGNDERKATRTAGEIAGLHVLAIINEPTAAAIAYGMEATEDQVVLVYDLGGGTFDVTLLEINARAINVIVTGGDHHLGGKDWDQYVMDHLISQYQAEKGLDPVELPEDLQKLALDVEAGKKALSLRPKNRFMLGTAPRMSIELTTEQFDAITEPLLNNTITLTRNLLKEAEQKGYTRFDRLLLVGGSTRMPQVARRLQQEFGIDPQLFDPDEAVARGAARYAHKMMIEGEIIKIVEQITGQKVEQDAFEQIDTQVRTNAQRQVADKLGLQVQIVDQIAQATISNVTSRGYGVVALSREEPESLYLAVLIMKNETVPTTASQRFGTVQDNQTLVEIRVMETLAPDATVKDLEQCKELGLAVLELPPGLPQSAPIDIHFDLDSEGILHLTGTDATHGNQVTARLQTDSGMSADEIAQAKAHARQVQIV